MKKLLASCLGLSFSLTAIANPSGFSMLNGVYNNEDGFPTYLFDGTAKASLVEGNACQFEGKLIQSHNSRLDFTYINKSHNGSVDCSDYVPDPLKIHVVSIDTKTGIATKIKITTRKTDAELGGIFELAK